MRFAVAMIMFMSTAAGAAAPDGIVVHEPWTPEAPPGAPMAGYVELRNHTPEARTLVRATAEGFGHTGMHRTVHRGGVARMVPVERLEIPANGQVRFEPGGLHIMLMQPERHLRAGDTIRITLGFEDGSEIGARFAVRSGPGSGSGGHGSNESHDAPEE